MEPNLVNIVVGSIAVIGGVVAVILTILCKINLIQFGKKKEEGRMVMPIEWPSYKETVNKVNTIHDKQLINIELHNQHLASFREGKEEFKEIKDALRLIGENIAVLKDRSDREYGKG